MSDGSCSEASVWREILSVARWTPSPHNTQPWKLEIQDGRRATLLLDHRRTLPKEDTTGRFLDCAMGCFIESLRILAQSKGFGLLVSEADGPRRGDLEPFARVTLEPGVGGPAEFPIDLFVRRATSRLPAETVPIDRDDAALLKSIASEGGQRFVLLTEPAAVERLMREDLRAVVQDMNTPSYRGEIVQWFRYSRAEAARKRDGLSAECMRCSGLELYLLGKAPFAARWPLAGRAVRAMYRRKIGHVPQLGVLCGDFRSRPAATSAGRCLMRLWLTMTRLGLAIHPFGNLITNEAARRVVVATVGEADPWLVFRIGRTPEPPRSHRLSEAELIRE